MGFQCRFAGVSAVHTVRPTVLGDQHQEIPIRLELFEGLLWLTVGTGVQIGEVPLKDPGDDRKMAEFIEVDDQPFTNSFEGGLLVHVVWGGQDAPG